jgi:hypothetical protein
MFSPESGKDPRGEYRAASGGPGCLSAFIVLWGVAFLVVGLLITAVSGYCSIVVFSDGGTGATSLGGPLFAGVILGVFLCVLGYFMMRGFGGNR